MLWRSVFVTHLLVILVLGCFYWGQVTGLTPALRRAEAFNVLVFSEIGYCVTTRFIKASTFHKRALVSRRPVLQALAGADSGVHLLATAVRGQVAWHTSGDVYSGGCLCISQSSSLVVLSWCCRWATNGRSGASW